MKKETTVKNPHLAQLLDLMKENPHLPIVPMVDTVPQLVQAIVERLPQLVEAAINDAVEELQEG